MSLLNKSSVTIRAENFPSSTPHLQQVSLSVADLCDTDNPHTETQVDSLIRRFAAIHQRYNRDRQTNTHTQPIR